MKHYEKINETRIKLERINYETSHSKAISQIQLIFSGGFESPYFGQKLGKDQIHKRSLSISKIDNFKLSIAPSKILYTANFSMNAEENSLEFRTYKLSSNFHSLITH